MQPVGVYSAHVKSPLGSKRFAAIYLLERKCFELRFFGAAPPEVLDGIARIEHNGSNVCIELWNRQKYQLKFHYEYDATQFLEDLVQLHWIIPQKKIHRLFFKRTVYVLV